MEYLVSKFEHCLSGRHIGSNCQIGLLLDHQLKEVLPKGVFCKFSPLLKREPADKDFSTVCQRCAFHEAGQTLLGCCCTFLNPVLHLKELILPRDFLSDLV